MGNPNWKYICKTDWSSLVLDRKEGAMNWSKRRYCSSGLWSLSSTTRENWGTCRRHWHPTAARHLFLDVFMHSTPKKAAIWRILHVYSSSPWIQIKSELVIADTLCRLAGSSRTEPEKVCATTGRAQELGVLDVSCEPTHPQHTVSNCSKCSHMSHAGSTFSTPATLLLPAPPLWLVASCY